MPHPPSILPSPYRPPTREQIERARTMYAEGFTVSRILAGCDMSLGTLYYWLDGGPREASRLPTSETSDVGCGLLYPPIPRRRAVLGKRRAPLPADRVSLMGRLWRASERQARDIEERLSRPGGASPERERDVRMLSTLVRTLRELSAFDSGAAPDEAQVEPALKAARERDTCEQALREAEERASVIRHMASYLREIGKIEALRTARNQAHARAQEDNTIEFQQEFARRVESFAAARREQEEQERLANVPSAPQSENRNAAPASRRT